MKMVKALKGDQAKRLKELQDEKRLTGKELYPSTLTNSPLRMNSNQSQITQALGSPDFKLMQRSSPDEMQIFHSNISNKRNSQSGYHTTIQHKGSNRYEGVLTPYVDDDVPEAQFVTQPS